MDSIKRISYLGFTEILCSNHTKKEFADLGAQHQSNTDGFIVPMRFSNRVFIELGDVELDYLNQMKDINQTFNEKHIELNIKSLGRLHEINKLLPDYFSRINFKYIYDWSEEIAEYSISEIMDNPDWINLKFIEISYPYMLSLDEFQFWWIILRSSKTRFYITTIELKFILLSECLTVLSLCSDCPELKFVELRYSETDIKNEDEVIKQAKREFRQKFGFIQKLYIWKNKE